MLLLVRPETVVFGADLYFAGNYFLNYILPRDLRAPLAYHREGKNVENLAQFWTTFDFDREYLRNGSRYQKLETKLIERNS